MLISIGKIIINCLPLLSSLLIKLERFSSLKRIYLHVFMPEVDTMICLWLHISTQIIALYR